MIPCVWCMIHWCLVCEMEWYTGVWCMSGVSCMIMRWWLVYDTQVLTVWYTAVCVWYTGVWCMIHWWVTGVWYYDTLVSSVWYTGDWCMIHWCLVYDTLVTGVWYTGGLAVGVRLILDNRKSQSSPGSILRVTPVCCGVWYSDVWCMIQWCLVYDTVMSGAWYSDEWCMIEWCLVYDTVMSGVWHMMQWWLVYDTGMSDVWYCRV